LLQAPRRPGYPLQHPPFPPPGGHPVRDRHDDTLAGVQGTRRLKAVPRAVLTDTPEIVERVAEAALGSVPVVGAALAVTFVTALGWRLEERREKWFTELADGVEALRLRMDGLSLEEGKGEAGQPRLAQRDPARGAAGPAVPTDRADRGLSSAVSSTTRTASPSSSRAAGQAAAASRTFWSSQTARDSRCCSRCGPQCPTASAMLQQ
jgi:hypothetical protein